MMPGGFSGEINMISGRRSLVRGRVTEAGEFLEVSQENLRSLIAKDAELSEIFMRAFILRRLVLITKGFGDVVVLGSMHCGGTLRLREFLSRNGHPYTYVDLDTDSQSQEFLDRFHVSIEEVPVLICRGTKVLRNPTSAGGCRLPGLEQSGRRIAGARRDRGGRRSVGSGGRGLCGLGRTQRAGD